MSGEGMNPLAARRISADDAGEQAAVTSQPDSPPAAPVASTPADADRVTFYPRGFSHPTSPAALLRQLGLRPRRGLSQSFLTDTGVTRAIATAAGLSADDDVLEVGPGLGILTHEVARRVRRVVAFELDRDLAAALPTLLPAHVQVVQGDALTLDPGDYLTAPYKLVANLPYQITSPFLFRYLSIEPAPSVLVLMVQREVAERVAARPGDLSYLAVAVQSAARVRLVRHVAPGSFHPRPRVESAVIKLEPLAEPLVPPAERQSFLDVVRAGFGQPRKQLLNSLHQGLTQAKPTVDWARDDVRALLEAAGLSTERRPQTLELAEWYDLHRAYQLAGHATRG
jgi:16S rRNA (adenine1518-N6/adenine1519-N6)-dimethyltransferase